MMFDILNNRLTNTSHVLNEADYSMPKGISEGRDENGNRISADADNATTSTNNQEEDAPSFDDNETDDTGVTDEEVTNEDNPSIDETEDNIDEEPSFDDTTEETELADIDVDNASKRSTIPELKVLNNLSDEEYNLNNLKCMKDFKNLAKIVDNSINNNIMNTITTNVQQRQAVKIVHDNLSQMINDMDNYLLSRFSSSYENNVTTYLTYLMRYKTALKIINHINKMNAELKDQKK